MNRLNRFFYFFIFLFLFSIVNVFAIGVSPASYHTDFVDYQSQEFKFSVLNKAQDSTRIVVTLEKALSEYASVSENDFIVGPNSQKEIIVKITYPSYKNIDIYGDQRLFIRIEEQPREGAGMQAVTAVVAQLKIDIPIPGEYGIIKDLQIPSIEKGENTKLTLILENKGTEPLTSKNAEVVLYSPTGDTKETYNFPNINILVGKELELKKDIISKSFVEGKYFADATFTFSSEKEQAQKNLTFFIGSTDIILDSYTKTITRGKINKIDLRLQSIWGSPLRGIRSELIINGETETLPVLDFDPFGISKINAHPDVPLDSPDKLQGDLIIKIPKSSGYEEKLIELTFDVVDSDDIIMPEDNTTNISNYTILIAGVILLIILLVGLNIYLLSKTKKRDKNEKK